MISLIYLTYRPCGIDTLTHSLSFTEGVQAGDYELVVVDDFPGRVDRGTALKHLQGRDIPVGWYGTSKPQTEPNARVGLANAMNTGALHARGSHVVFVHDYCFLQVNSVRAWLDEFAASDGKELIHGVGHMYDAPMPTFLGDVSTWGGKVDILGKWTWAPKEFELFYCGVPIHFLEEINGIDERSDVCGNFILFALIAQAKMHGYKLRVTEKLALHMVDHRCWDQSHALIDSVWKIRGELSTVEREPTWLYRSPNGYDFAEERKRLLSERESK